ncbi:MAG: two-component system, OmpR family, response regulator [Actinomycetota bacterium]|jgi:CheY-like chemotaxis protein|nr:two-component system, OmpR family, response regulator [Actinomycetota bacterium]MEA2487979.1 two-component system, OmpR family, response regulator [Actinomycetota bacterium]
MSRILLVEDDVFSLELVRAHLRKAGHKVIATDSAEGAMTILSEKDVPDVVVVDISLPGIDGRELARRLRREERTKDVRIIFLSATVEPKEIAISEELSNAYLTKPFVASALLARIEEVVAFDKVEGW